MKLKGKMFALVVILAAIGLVTATGAFSTVTAARTASISVAGDADALLGLSSNSPYTTTSGGELQFDFEDPPGNANGVNPNSTTVVLHLFTAQNNGAEPIELRYTKTGDNLDSVLLINTTTSNMNTQDVWATNTPISLGVGASKQFGMIIDTTSNNGNLLNTNAGTFNVNLVFNASATA